MSDDIPPATDARRENPTSFARDFGKRIKSARITAELSQTELGVRLDLTRSSIANIEAGRQGCGVELLHAITGILNVSADWLLTGQQFGAPRPPSGISRTWLRKKAGDLRLVLDELDSKLGAP